MVLPVARQASGGHARGAVAEPRVHLPQRQPRGAVRHHRVGAHSRQLELGRHPAAHCARVL
eukprot:scaffold68830_cov54-Phaeocystis_antarctica.AAC.1